MKVNELLPCTPPRQTNYKQLLRVLKCTMVLLLVACLQVYATGISQEKISLRLQQADLKQALKLIEKQSQVRFLYSQEVLKSAGKVSVDAENEALVKVLDEMLAGTGITYKLLDDDLVVLNLQAELENADIKITGKVTDSSGTAIAGASVTIKGTAIGTATDANGNFTLNAPDDATLVISAVGFGSREIAVNGRTSINATLVATARSLDDVVVVGYGSQRKLDVTGAVASVKGEEVSKQASNNVVSGLQGKVAGVQITNVGTPGGTPQMRIRGNGTVYGNPNPLYVVDGVWFDDINFLNPADIDNISILKDASSESIYGIRAANGVVLVTTKKGKSGRSMVTYNGNVGWQKATNQVDMANANEYATVINEKQAILGKPPLLNPADFSEGTNWYNNALRDALTTNHQIGISGGTEKATYNFSLGYLMQEGIIKTNDYQRVTARLQTDFQVLKPLRMGYSVLGTTNKSNDIPSTIFHQLYAASPVVPVYYADGTYGDPNDFKLGDGANFNPQATLDFYDQQTMGARINGSIFADLKISKNFSFRSSFGGEYGETEIKNYAPEYKATLAQQRDISKLTVIRAETRNWILENTLTYDKSFGDHKIKALAGQSAQQYKSYELTASAENVPNTRRGDHYLRLGNVAGRSVDDKGDLSTVSSYFGRVNYSYQNKYLLTASLRADGSSKFTDDQRWGYFPSVGLGWVVTKEDFMQNQKIFDLLKLRGSWGKIGNASVPSNISTLVVNQGAFLTAIFGGQPYTGASITSIVPPTTYWERGVGTDIGLEAAFLNHRLTVDADYYIKKTEQAIFSIPILGSVGTTSSTIVGNQATFENKGFELAVGWKDSPGKDFSYSINANMSVNDNKVLEVSTGANPIYGGGFGATGGAYTTRTVLGEPIGQFFGRKVVGIFQSQSDIDNYKNSHGIIIQPNAQPGDFKYQDTNDDGRVDDKDRVVLGNPNPRFNYGINTFFEYRNFDLALDFQGVAGVEIYNANSAIRFGNENYTKDYFDNRWHGSGTSNTYPNPNIGGSTNYLPNSFFVENGSYFRVRNMQLGYTLPASLTNKWHISKLRAFVTAQNALNFFNYKGFSPEVGGTNPTASGIDTNVYPLYATYLFGVNVTF
ncbi:MAG TPA: TonB-dependent receptor [Phnomibacter sp.]|nr:TonB-dependent receptor [Phnomibacter sp.]